MIVGPGRDEEYDDAQNPERLAQIGARLLGRLWLAKLDDVLVHMLFFHRYLIGIEYGSSVRCKALDLNVFHRIENRREKRGLGLQQAKRLDSGRESVQLVLRYSDSELLCEYGYEFETKIDYF